MEKQLRVIEFEKENTAALIYDKLPIIAYFKYVNGDTVAGAMES